MFSSRAAIIFAVLATLFAVGCHPRIFFGSGSPGFNIVNLDGVFFLGQWLAFLFALISLIVSVKVLRSGSTGMAVMVTTGYAACLLLFQIFTGIPHKANENAWRTGELGPGAFIRGMTKNSGANAKLVHLSGDEFGGKWTAADGSIYEFTTNTVKWEGGASSGFLSPDACRKGYSMEYIQREKKELQEHGLTWSAHAGAVHDATPDDAKIPTLEVACKGTHYLFIRATEDEVWRWTTDMDANDFKEPAGFVLKRAPG